MSNSRVAAHVAVPIKLAPFLEDEDEERVLHVVVETARGGRNKMAYDEELGVLGCKGPRGAWKIVKAGSRLWKRETKRRGS